MRVEPLSAIENSVVHTVRGGASPHARYQPPQITSGLMRTVKRSAHFVRGANAEQCKPGGKYVDYTLHKGKASLRQHWIILDNEA